MSITLFSDDLELEKRKKVITWDRESIYDLIDLLEENPHHESLVEAEYPIPPNIKSKFPFIVAMDKSGMCLTSVVEMSVDMLSDLQIKLDLEEKLSSIVDLNYIDGKVHIRNMMFNVCNLLIGEKIKTCYIEQLFDRAYIYSNSDDSPILPSFDKNEPVEWFIVSHNKPITSDISPNFEQAVIHCGLSSSTF